LEYGAYHAGFRSNRRPTLLPPNQTGLRDILPEFLPDGNHFFYATRAGVYLSALDNPKPRKVLND
jgi:hypothetical protein